MLTRVKQTEQQEKKAKAAADKQAAKEQANEERRHKQIEKANSKKAKEEEQKAIAAAEKDHAISVAFVNFRTEIELERIALGKHIKATLIATFVIHHSQSPIKR